MRLLPLRSNLEWNSENDLLFSVYTVGTEKQPPITRLAGFSATQLFLTFGGSGRFRGIGQDKWDILTPGDLLIIPAGYPHEYMPLKEDEWHVGYVSYVENTGGMLAGWGIGGKAEVTAVTEIDRLHALIERIWSLSGPDYDPWAASETLFSFCMALKRQMRPASPRIQNRGKEPAARYPDMVVDAAVRFLHDHLNRHIAISQLATHVGYSQKQLTRFFLQTHGTTPLQYLHNIRMQAADLMLSENPGMAVKQVAAFVGMEPEYFTRVYKRSYGLLPSERSRSS